MQLLYVDESGNSHINSSQSNTHFVLAGIAMDAAYWKQHNEQIKNLKTSRSLGEQEIHTAWILRTYGFQNKIPDFSSFTEIERRSKAEEFIHSEIQKAKQGTRKNIKKDWKIIKPYSHLLLAERNDFIRDICHLISKWGYMRIFLIIVNKEAYKPKYSIYEDAFEQLISRFQRFIQNVSPNDYGIIAMDNNQTISQRINILSNLFHASGTRYVSIPNIIDTPYFVDSKMTSMIQIADIVAYGARRFYEKGDSTLYDIYKSRIDANRNQLVGLRVLP